MYRIKDNIEKSSKILSKLSSCIKYFSIPKLISDVTPKVWSFFFFHPWQKCAIVMTVDIGGISGGQNNMFNNSSVCLSPLSGGSKLMLIISLAVSPMKRLQYRGERVILTGAY